MASKPVLAVTGPDKGGSMAWLFTAIAIWRAGGRPRRFTPGRNASLDGVCGFVIGGGSDVSPDLYEEDGIVSLLKDVAEEDEKLADANVRLLDRLIFPLIFLLRYLFSRKESTGLDPARDKMETELISHALKHRLPLMGICRGSQLLNVHLGGNLHQNLDKFYEETPNVRNVFPRKKIFIEPESRLARVMGRSKTRVNALHNQAVNEPGNNVEPVAHEETGVIQGIEYQNQPYVIGVQWHPEYMPQVRSQVRLFEKLVQEAARHCTGSQ